MLIKLSQFIYGLWIKFLNALADRAEKLEHGSDIDYSDNEFLGNIADKVGAKKITDDNAKLRQLIKGRIAGKNSNGTLPDMEATFSHFTKDEGQVKEYPLTLEFIAHKDFILFPEPCLEYLRRSKPAGIRINGIILEEDDSFKFDESIMPDIGETGDKLADMIF